MADEVQTVASAGAMGIEPVTADALADAKHSKWHAWRKDGKALIDYLLDSEVHTYAFSVAANAILSFIPFILLLYQLAHGVFHSDDMTNVVDQMVNYFLPVAATTEPDFIARNIKILAEASRGVTAASLAMILIACTGIFLPLEVALNQAWGVTKSRNYIMNQTLALGLSLVMAALALASMILNGALLWIIHMLPYGAADSGFFHWLYSTIRYVWLAVTTGVASILFFFCIYWVLPNRKVPWMPVLRTSIWTGIIWLVAKLIFVAVLPHMHLRDLYGPFFNSVGLLFWSYVSGLILFAGAQFSVSRWGDKKTE